MFGVAIMGPYLWGLLPHFIIFAMIVDLLSKRIHEIFWIVPIFIYGGYYAFYIAEENQIKMIQEELQIANPKFILQYDPNKHILITQDQGGLGQYYKIPVTYEGNSNFPEGALSYRVASPPLCNKARNLQIENMYTFGFSWMEFKEFSGRDYFFRPDACQIRSAEVLPSDKNVLKIVRTDEDSDAKNNKDKKIYKTTYDFYLNDTKEGTFTTARASHLPIFPFFMGGCGLNSARASWDCFADFYRKPKQLNVYPEGITVDVSRANPIAVMLGLKKYEEADLKSFSDYPETIKYVNDLYQKKRNEKPEDFNEWGIHKDSLHMPKIGKSEGVDSFEGIVESGNKGGEFYSFIKKHEGQIVYLNIDARSNQSYNSFQNYGVCKIRENCSGRTDDSYQFFNKDGSNHVFSEEGKFKGFFQVGAAELFENQYNMGDNDTITKLIFINSDTLADGVQ